MCLSSLRRTALATFALVAMFAPTFAADAKSPPAEDDSFEALIPNDALKRPFTKQTPIIFVTRGKDAKEWESLKAYWNEMTEEVVDPNTNQKVKRTVVKIKLPLGINVAPQSPPENPMTVGKWILGKHLYYDKILSSDSTVACASCHAPEKGFTDQNTTSFGIASQKGGMNAPTVLNSAFGKNQFWDGRAASLEDQAQGPVQNPIEMFDGKGNAWEEAIKRLRAKPDYVKQFKEEFGHLPTRDAAAKAIATYERTVIVGNSIHDRAEVAMRKRVDDAERNDYTIQAKDYETVLKAAFAAKDKHNLSALLLDVEKDAEKIADVAKSVNNGRALYFSKARCNLCHVGESFTDLTYHNLGVGVVDGKLPKDALGRFGAQPTGAKDPSMIGSFKTPPLRGLLSTKPYMHDGKEKTLEDVVELYERGGNANEFLDPKMRDTQAEIDYMKAKQSGTAWKGPEVKVFTRDGKPIIPLKLNLTPQEKKDLVMFLRALEGDPVDPMVADPKKFPEMK